MNRRDAFKACLLALAVADTLAQAARPRQPVVLPPDPEIEAWNELTRRLAEDAESGTWPKE